MADLRPRRLWRWYQRGVIANRPSARKTVIPWAGPIVVEMTYLPPLVAVDWLASRIHLEPDVRAPLTALIGVFTVLWLGDFASSEVKRLRHRRAALAIGGLASLAFPLLLTARMTDTAVHEFWPPRVIAVAGATAGAYVFVAITHLPVRIDAADLLPDPAAPALPIRRAYAAQRERFLAPKARLVVYNAYQRVLYFAVFMPLTVLGVVLVIVGLQHGAWRATGAVVLVLAFSAWIAVRSVRVAVLADPYAVTVRNVLVTRHIPWSHITRIVRPSEDRHRRLRIDRLSGDPIRCTGLAAGWLQPPRSLDARAELLIELIECGGVEQFALPAGPIVPTRADAAFP